MSKKPNPKALEGRSATLGRRERRQVETASGGSGRLVRRLLKTSELVALEIVRDISDRKLAPGDRLPLESEMLALYQVSRASLREALRLLEVQGLIAIRPGPGASTVVGRVLPANLARTLMLYLHQGGATYDQLLVAWETTEPMLARLAARNPDRARVQAAMKPFMSEAVLDSRDSQPIEAAIGFHDIVAQLTDNIVLDLMFQSIGHLMSDHVLNVMVRDTLAPDIVEDHAEIARAIHDGDADEATRLMERHVATVIKDFRAFWPRRVGDRVKLV